MASPPRRTWAELVTAVEEVVSIPDRDAALFAVGVDLIPTAIGYISTVMPSQQCAHLRLIHHLFSQNLNLDLMAKAILNMPVLDPARSVVSDRPPPVAPSRSSALTAATPKPCPTPRPVAKPTRSSGGASDTSTVHPRPTPYVEIPPMKVERSGRVQPESPKVEMKRVESPRLDRRPAEPPKMETRSRVAQTQWAPTDGASRCARCIKEGRQCLIRVGGGPAHACQNCHTSKVKCERFIPQPVLASRSATMVTVVPSPPLPLVQPVCKRSQLASDADDTTSAGTAPAISRMQSGSSSSSGFQMMPMSPPYLDPRITHLERDMANMHRSLEDLHGMVQDMAATQKAGFERLMAQGRPPNLPRASASTSARVQPPLQALYKAPARPTASGSVAKVALSSTPSAAATVESEGESDEEEANDKEDDEDYGEVDEGPSAGAA
ncbi:hypothetical protein NEOLEDRAFT_1176777 [Neolentinus lepideus HHB14362 ss-1]|uniref:Zn(2)-C6 fungal-type domain-containing protein n=1 Tax=Neolentinus lepideus HHB14362 ss-1 TaxID=1314782 RepID=A0A165TY61_9AGAM|nr:hypothetical protein NEOLEDRAFT_1176777 [Neolentinus lepideus HHB14362 ss-1]